MSATRAGRRAGKVCPARVRPFCRIRSCTTGRGEARDLQLPRLHAQLREDEEDGSFCGAAADDAQADAGEVAGSEGRAATPSAHDHRRAGKVPESGGARAPAVLRGAPQHASAQSLSPGDRLAVVEVAESTKPTRPRQTGADGTYLPIQPSASSHLSPLSISAAPRQNLRQEPDAVIPHVRICAGGAG